jgi:hypothetical protein
MEYFDGTEDELKQSRLNRVGGTYWIRSFSSGSTPFRLAWGPLKITIMATVITTMVLMGCMALLGLALGDTFILTVLLIATFVMVFFFAGTVLLILFIMMYAASGKLLGNNRTSLASDGIGFRFQRDINLPEQLTIVPYEYIVNIHPVTDDEWTRELGMGNFFRKLAGKPKDLPNVRYPGGCRWSSVYVLQMSSDMPMKSIRKKVGAFGKLGAFTLTPMVAYYDQYIDENKGRCSKIFFSLKHDEYDEFVKLLDQARNRGS